MIYYLDWSQWVAKFKRKRSLGADVLLLSMRGQVVLVKVGHLCTTSSKEPGNFALKCGNTTIYLIMARGTSLSVSAENINGIISIMDLVCCTRLGNHKWGLPLSLKL